ncbi:MAG TPA: glycosyltransferase family 39 protein [Vicinamibacterales bacterium]|nr:glycosyltransferase family 39 protein [Vicinamibacterales bacterium]
MTQRRFAAALLAIALLALTLRVIFPAADPPWRPTVGIVWHDEGAWTHNARNKALFGAWRLDNWNPVYVAPVFTALEYAAFETLGVGLRQARLVSQLAGFLSVVLLALGVCRIAGRVAGVIAGGLLATNYVYVMYGRAAIMESLMAALIVASWYCSTRAEKQPMWGALAGVCATLAFFTKAAAAFYVGALGLVVAARMLDRERTSASWTIAGLAASFAAVGLFFVLPHWADYQFYNWQMSVTRKPSYDLASLAMRFSWFPVIHDTFSRMWFALCLGLFGGWGIAVRWRQAGDGERLLLLWLAVGSIELLVHDVGNERRFVFLIPVLVALAGIVLARGTLLPAEAADVPRKRVLLAAPLLLYSAYVLFGPLVRVPFLEQVRANVFRMPVRLAVVSALVMVAVLLLGWARAARLLTSLRWRPAFAGGFLGLAMTWHLAQFVDYARHRTYENYAASIALGRVLPPGTAVQGKLANGLALENRIRPIFIGHEFGNYADRKDRWDVRYILTYTDPEIGYEGDQILDVLAAYPGWRIIMTFDVAETRSGHDTAALIEKRARD